MSTLITGISSSELETIIKIDSKTLSTDSNGFCRANRELYTIACNTWLLMCEECAGSVARRVLFNSMMRDGLVKTIDTTARIASESIRLNFNYVPDSPLRALLCEDPRITLQLLRYLKRFSPFKADKVITAGYEAFLKVNLQCKGVPLVINDKGKVLKRTHYYPKWLISAVSSYCYELLDPNVDLSDDNIEYWGSFSNGATADGCHLLIEKYAAYSKHATYYKHYTYPLSRCVIPDLDYVKCVAVPKSYKVPRIIAECPAYSQYHLQGIRRLCEMSLEKSMNSDLIILDDQRINQEWSRLGSIYGCYATVDLSAASDSISLDLAMQVLPGSWFGAIERWNPHKIQVQGKEYPRYIFQTSGNGTTFIVESVIFLSIALAATSYVQSFLGEWVAAPRVYGDDIICDDRVYDTLVDFLDMLGFNVNTDKSFTGSHRYRESCGSEWFCGLDTATKYFPRKSFTTNKPEGLQAAIALQHRLFEFKLCDEWLCDYIRTASRTYFKIEMTSSYPGTDCADLWEDFPLFAVVRPPFDHNKSCGADPTNLREVHYALLTKETKEMLASAQGLPVQNQLETAELFAYVNFLCHGSKPSEVVPLKIRGVTVAEVPVFAEHKEPVSACHKVVSVWERIRV